MKLRNQVFIKDKLKINAAIKDSTGSPSSKPSSKCTVLPPPCASGFHTDSNGDCVSDVSVPEITTHGKTTCQSGYITDG